jgi:hypothetical protein
VRDEARRLIACGILGVLVDTMLLAVHPTQIVLIALGLFVVSFARYSLLASEAAMIQGSRVLLLIARMALAFRVIRGM